MDAASPVFDILGVHNLSLQSTPACRRREAPNAAPRLPGTREPRGALGRAHDDLGISGENAGMQKMVDQGAMRHMAHSCVTFMPEVSRFVREISDFCGQHQRVCGPASALKSSHRTRPEIRRKI